MNGQFRFSELARTGSQMFDLYLVGSRPYVSYSNLLSGSPVGSSYCFHIQICSAIHVQSAACIWMDVKPLLLLPGAEKDSVAIYVYFFRKYETFSTCTSLHSSGAEKRSAAIYGLCSHEVGKKFIMHKYSFIMKWKGFSVHTSSSRRPCAFSSKHQPTAPRCG